MGSRHRWSDLAFRGEGMAAALRMSNGSKSVTAVNDISLLPPPAALTGYPEMDEMDTRSAAKVLIALAHDLRLELWRMLMPLGEKGLSAGMIATRLAIPPSSLSFHLQQMTQAGVLTQRRRSRYIIYAANNEVVIELCRYLASARNDGGLLAPTLSEPEPQHIVGQ
jgi:ArsR family transcriptional regulator, arsenate/arsenite/antimonite-responsive transcriptional repressor